MTHSSSNSALANGQKTLPRRQFLQLLTAGSIAAGAAFPKVSSAGITRNWLARELTFFNTHTGETASLTYFEQGQYIPQALQEIDRLFRDHRSGDIYPIDPNLLNVLYKLQETLDISRPFHIISGYRSQESNSELHLHSSGVAKNSLHMQGKAVDIRIEGVETRTIRDAAIFLQQGGVGYYPGSDFVHVDTGLVRYW